MWLEWKGLGGKSWLYVAIAVMLVVLTGCGSTPAETTSASSKQDTKVATTADTRTIKDAYGDVQIPTQPSRVVVLDIGALDNLLELGIKPIGAPSILAAGDPYPAYLKGTEGIKNIGSVNEPNLEAIDALKPDLIIGNKDTHDAIYKQLSQIAPTLFVNTLGVTWKENLQLHAEAVNKQEVGKKLMETYQKHADELKSKYAGSTPKEVSLFRPRKDKLQIYMKKNFSGIIMEDAGIVRPAAQREASFSKDITEEQIAELDGDMILWFNREPDAFAKLEKGSLWGTLKGVQKKAVYPVDWEYWLSGLGIQAANKVLNDLNTFAGK